MINENREGKSHYPYMREVLGMIDKIKRLEDLLEQAAIIIEPKKNKIVYRSARQAWVEQYRALNLKGPI